MRDRPGFRECLTFPIATPEARRDLLVGGTVMFTLLIGWILNLGHRLDVVHRLCHGDRPYHRGFAPWGRTFVRGLKAFTAIATYLCPAALFGTSAFLLGRAGAAFTSTACWIVGALFFVWGVYSLPGGMTYNAAYDDITYLYRPDKAFRRALAGGAAYGWAWVIACSAMSLSFLGLLGLGVGFFYTSVWAWTVVGYAFSRALVLSDLPARKP